MYTGARLASPREFQNVFRIGKEQFVIFVSTLVGVLATDLLIGVGIGIVVKLAIHVLNGVPFRSMFKPYLVVESQADGTSVIRAKDSAVFSNWIPFKRQIEQLGLAQHSNLVVDLSETKLVDHSVMEKLHELQEEFEQEGLTLELTGLDSHRKFSEHEASARRRGLVWIRRITIITEEAQRERLIGELLRRGATGYTAVECTGVGRRTRDQDKPVPTPMVRLEILVGPEKFEGVIDYLRKQMQSDLRMTVCRRQGRGHSSRPLLISDSVGEPPAGDAGAGGSFQVRMSCTLCAAAQDLLGGPMSRGDARLGKEASPRIRADKVSTAIRSRGVIASDTVEMCRTPVNRIEIGPHHGNSVQSCRGDDGNAHVGADLDGAIHQQFRRDEAQGAGKSNRSQSRQQEADRQRWRMLVQAMVIGQGEPAEAELQRAQGQAKAAEREDHREPEAERSGQGDLGVQFQPDQHQRGMAQEQKREESPCLALNGRHPRGVDRGEERGQADALQHPIRCDRHDEPHHGEDSGQGRHEEQGNAQRGVLEPVAHPAVGRHGSTANQDSGHQEHGGPGRRCGRRGRIRRPPSRSASGSRTTPCAARRRAWAGGD